MTPEQKKRLDEISARWRKAETGDNRHTAQAVYDIAYLTGIIFDLEDRLANPRA